MTNMIQLLTSQVEHSQLVVLCSCKGEKGSEKKREGRRRGNTMIREGRGRDKRERMERGRGKK